MARLATVATGGTGEAWDLATITLYQRPRIERCSEHVNIMTTPKPFDSEVVGVFPPEVSPGAAGYRLMATRPETLSL